MYVAATENVGRELRPCAVAESKFQKKPARPSQVGRYTRYNVARPAMGRLTAVDPANAKSVLAHCAVASEGRAANRARRQAMFKQSLAAPGRSPAVIQELAYAMQSIRRYIGSRRRQAARSGLRLRSPPRVHDHRVGDRHDDHEHFRRRRGARLSRFAVVPPRGVGRPSREGRHRLARQRARLTSAAQSITFTGSTYTLSGAKSFDDPNSASTPSTSGSRLTRSTALRRTFASTQVIIVRRLRHALQRRHGRALGQDAPVHVTVNGTTGTTPSPAATRAAARPQVTGG